MGHLSCEHTIQEYIQELQKRTAASSLFCTLLKNYFLKRGGGRQNLKVQQWNKMFLKEKNVSIRKDYNNDGRTTHKFLYIISKYLKTNPHTITIYMHCIWMLRVLKSWIHWFPIYQVHKMTNHGALLINWKLSKRRKGNWLPLPFLSNKGIHFPFQNSCQ